MQREKPWCKRPFGESNPAVGPLFEIGEAAFAPCPVDNEFYVETTWGGLYGEGRLIAVSPEGGVRRKERVWVA